MEASIKSHEKQRTGIKQRVQLLSWSLNAFCSPLNANFLTFRHLQLQQLQVKGDMDAEKAEELAFTLDEKTQSVSSGYSHTWQGLLMHSCMS